MKLGIPEISSLEYNFTSTTLTCISTGGLATNVTWARNDALIISDSAQQQVVVDGATGTYHNLLTINSTEIRDYSGNFTCTVSNNRGTSNTSSVDLSGEKDTLLCSDKFYSILIQSLA